jgi:glycyl-tRNA synthetase alpha subunit
MGVIALVLAIILYAALRPPAYIQRVNRCNLAPDQICLDVFIGFNSVVGNGTMHLLTVAQQNGAQYWRMDYVHPHAFRPPEQLIWYVIIPVNATVINSFSFQFTLVVNGAPVDSRTVGWQGG